jgi:CheY-like chemotaxis protein
VNVFVQLRILVVDDQRGMRDTLAMLLRAHGFIVSVAAGGAEAMATCEREPAYDAVLLDAYMPDIGGLTVARFLRQRHPQTRLVLCTGADEQETRRAVASGQVNCALHKPFEIDDVLRALADD